MSDKPIAPWMREAVQRILDHVERQRGFMSTHEAENIIAAHAPYDRLIAAARAVCDRCPWCNGRGSSGGDPELGPLPCCVCGELLARLAELEKQ